MRHPALKAHRQQLHFDIKVSKLLFKKKTTKNTHTQTAKHSVGHNIHYKELPQGKLFAEPFQATEKQHIK